MSPTTPRNGKLKWIPTSKVVPNQNNPRHPRHFTKEELIPLKMSIKEHGILQPLLVQPFRDGPRQDRFELIEGERRYTVAKDLKMKEVPAIIGDKLDDHDQLVVMYNVHTQFQGWEMAEELRTIQGLLERNSDRDESEIAAELGMTLATFKGRLRVLDMGPEVLKAIATDKVDYSSALRAAEVASSLRTKRPDVVESLGGQKAIERKLVDKAKARGKGKGISQELVEAKRDLRDVAAVPDEVIEKYVTNTHANLRDVRSEQASLEERRQTETLARELRKTAKEIRSFNVDVATVPNLRELRAGLSILIESAQELEVAVVDALLAEGDE